MKTGQSKKRYWNFSTDCNPRHPYNIGRIKDLCTSKDECTLAAQAWCKSEGIKYDESMVAEVTDILK